MEKVEGEREHENLLDARPEAAALEESFEFTGTWEVGGELQHA